MISIPEAALHEVKQFTVFAIWLCVWTLLLTQLSFLFPDLYLDIVKLLAILFILLRSIAQDWVKVYNADDEIPTFPVHAARLVVNVCIGFIITQIIQVCCQIPYSVALTGASNLSIFEPGTINCGCNSSVCHFFISGLCLCIAVCRFRLQITALSAAVSFGRLLANWLFWDEQ